MVGITIYAESLSYIGQISVVASLNTAVDASTKVEITNEGWVINVYHQNETQDLLLPSISTVRGPIALPLDKSSSLAWKLPIDKERTSKSSLSRSSLDAQTVPWSAFHLKSGASFCCRHCSLEFIREGVILHWKDLPSENWAEMMEFWHCHKPYSNDDDQTECDTVHNQDSSAQKGYGASNIVTAKSRIGFVDIASLMFSETDCHGLLVSQCFIFKFGKKEGDQVNIARCLL